MAAKIENTLTMKISQFMVYCKLISNYHTLNTLCWNLLVSSLCESVPVALILIVSATEGIVRPR